jgi:hypothetical protein
MDRPYIAILTKLQKNIYTSDVFQGERGGTRGNAGERGGTPSPHLFYHGNGVPPAKIKHGGTAFHLAGIKYE